MLALPRPGWFNESSAASDALEVFDPIVPLQVLHQASLLGEGFRAQCAVVVLNARVDLFMSCPHVGEAHSGLATFEPAGVFLFACVSCHVPAKIIFVTTIMSTNSAYAGVLLVVLILHMIGKGWPREKVLTALVTVEVSGSPVNEHVRLKTGFPFESLSTLNANKVLLVAVSHHVLNHPQFVKLQFTQITFLLYFVFVHSMCSNFMFFQQIRSFKGF